MILETWMIAVTVAGTRTASFQSQYVEDIGETSALFMVEIIQSLYHQTWIQSSSRKQGGSVERSKRPFDVNVNEHKDVGFEVREFPCIFFRIGDLVVITWVGNNI
jgi:hypothetical protein